MPANDAPLVVAVSADLMELIPGFLANRARELAELQEAMGQGDFAHIRAVGHRLRGVADSYGFFLLTPLALGLEHAGGEEDLEACRRVIAEYAQLLPRLQVSSLDPDV